MKRKTYIVFCANDTVKINTAFITQKIFDLKQLKHNEVINLITLKVVATSGVDELPFIARIAGGDGSIESPFCLGIEARKGVNYNDNIGFVYRGETKVFNPYIP